MMQSLTLLVHGESGVGKSWLGDTVPGPRLIIDAEGGSTFTPSEKVYWDSQTGAPPEGHDSVVTLVRDFTTLQRIFQWLNSGQHPFKSVVLDSLTEIQKRCMDVIAGTNQPTQQNWGQLLRDMETLVRQFRDLKMHPLRPLEVVMFITTSKPDSGKLRPHVQGQLMLTLPQYVDVVGYMYVQPDAAGQLARILMVQPYPGFVAKDRTSKLDPYVQNPNVGQMMEVIYGNG
jgi:hypothetical protein